ncbi:hypothetical protein AMATHDRAFT_60699 [Amanita thiersii Skay4041]|uniref:Phosphodiesterase n=1 Tax=Amanita thiersii Skay4041 TaxID=703135 RepID=A0A2A9NQR5_9AGAR|nr:hypothetical protein AMATHDRAFT_60699 [Amanita thiersii Skay4041]
MSGAAPKPTSPLSSVVSDILPRHWRRRSADIGVISLATGAGGHGQGWMGHSGELETGFAELLGYMYTQTLHAVNEQHAEFVSTDLTPETRSRLINNLDRWHFEPHRLPEEQLVACTLLLFELLFRIEGMKDVIPVSMQQISAFVHHLRRIYRLENSYHNFEHALDVLQATHSYLQAAGMVPSVKILLKPNQTWKTSKEFNDGSLVSTLRPEEIFIMYIAAIGHDVGHPGFSNYFMKVAEAPLAKIYDGQSPLEQMHYQLLLRVMHHHGLAVLFNNPVSGSHLRKLLWSSVLATDMSVHNHFMDRLRLDLDHEQGTLCSRQILVSQMLLKCADISNPSRPYPVSQYWATALVTEWVKQATYEKSLDFKPSVQDSATPLKEARSQVSFIENFAQPLLELSSKATPEMQKYLQECIKNQKKWKIRVRELEARPQDPDNDHTTPLQDADDYINVFPLTLPLSRQVCEQREEIMSSESGTGTPTGSEALSISDPAVFMQDQHAAIRAAGKMGVRQQRSFNRNSWTPTPSSRFTGSSARNQPSISSPLANVQEASGSSPTIENQ